MLFLRLCQFRNARETALREFHRIPDFFWENKSRERKKSHRNFRAKTFASFLHFHIGKKDAKVLARKFLCDIPGNSGSTEQRREFRPTLAIPIRMTI